MQSRIATHVRRRFGDLVEASIPQFALNDSEVLPAVYSLYSWQACPQFSVHLCLQMHRRRDAFNVEVGWSEMGRWPQCLPTGPKYQPRNGELLFRLPRLWQETPYDSWWELTGTTKDFWAKGLDQVLQAIKPTFAAEVGEADLVAADRQVDDCFSKIIEYAVPYLNQIIAAHGCDATIKVAAPIPQPSE